MPPTFSSYESGSATGGAARRQDARTHMSFDFHGVISSIIASVPIARRSASPMPARSFIAAQTPQRVPPPPPGGAMASAPART
jgi:hypothetical protein